MIEEQVKQHATVVAKQFLELIQGEADIDGEHYSPCFRDCLGDNKEWVAGRLATLLAAYINSGQK